MLSGGVVMSSALQDWRLELIEAHSDLFRPPAGGPKGAEGLPECGPGWRDLTDRCCVRIRTALDADGGIFRFSQIKEKYGWIRMYWTGRLSPEASARVEEAMDLAEARSGCTCEICGEAGVLRKGGWPTTRCDLHAEGPPPPRSGPASRTSISSATAWANSGGSSAAATIGAPTPSWTSIPPPSVSRRTEMATFRCRTCHQEGECVYDAARHACPRCGSREVRFAIGVDEMPDPLVDAILELADGAESAVHFKRITRKLPVHGWLQPFHSHCVAR